MSAPSPLVTNVAYAASIGHSVWFSRDLGDSWQRANTHSGGIYNESRCWSLATHPEAPGEALAGTDDGLYRWREEDKSWRHVPSPFDGLHVLKVAQAPSDPKIILAGTRPAGVYASFDGGQRWTRASLPGSIEAPYINTHRVTSIKFDPERHGWVWVTIEIDGIWLSTDWGRTFTRRSNGLPDLDVHNVEFAHVRGRRVVYAATEVGLFRSYDDGEKFEPAPAPAAAYTYFRCLTRKADSSGTLFLTIGDRPSGDASQLLRSRDAGETWEIVPLDPAPTTTLWHVATHDSDPRLIFVTSIFGEIYRSLDGGDTFQRCRKLLGEVREIAWAPVPSALLGPAQKPWVTADEFAAEEQRRIG